jgi:hypothetical protein
MEVAWHTPNKSTKSNKSTPWMPSSCQDTSMEVAWHTPNKSTKSNKSTPWVSSSCQDTSKQVDQVQQEYSLDVVILPGYFQTSRPSPTRVLFGCRHLASRILWMTSLLSPVMTH